MYTNGILMQGSIDLDDRDVVGFHVVYVHRNQSDYTVEHRKP